MVSYPYLTNYSNMQQYNNQAQQQNNGIIWVQGIEAAKSYLVAPNNTVQLWDSENQSIYIKSADASGLPTIKVLDYTIRETEPKQTTVLDKKVDYVTKEELKVLESKINALQKVLEENDDEQSDIQHVNDTTI